MTNQITLLIIFKPSSSKKPQQQMKTHNSNSSREISLSSTFIFEDANIKDILKPIDFYIVKENDAIQQRALQPLPPQEPQLQMRAVQCTVVPPLPGQPHQHQVHQHQQLHPWLRNDHLHRQGSQQSTPFQQVYKDKYVCKGKTLKHQRKDIDIGALPCKAVKIQVKKGTQLCSKNISLIGMDALEIAQKFGDQYFKLLVENPMKILYFK